MIFVRPVVLAISTAMLLSASAAAAQPVAVTGCEETVVDGFLTADLDCTSSPGFGLTVADGGVLNLAGFQLTGSAWYGTTYEQAKRGGGVHCLGSCTIVGGGGAIVAPAGLPEQTWYSSGVYSDPEIKGALVEVSGVTLSGWPDAVQASKLSIRDSVFSGNGIGVLGHRRSTVDNCTFTGHTYNAVHSYVVTISNSTITGNYGGIYGLRKIRLENTIVGGNENYAFYGVKLTAHNSALGGNCLAPFPDTACADIFAFNRRPRLVNSSCGTSLRDDGLESWGICSGD